MHSDRNVAATHSIVSCRVNAAQPSGNPASAVKYPGALPSSSHPPHPTLRAATPLAQLGPAFPSCSLALASLLSPARLRTRRHGLPTQSRLHFLNSSASRLDPCLPPAPLPAKARRPARPSRMPAHLGPSRLRPASLDPHACALQLALGCQIILAPTPLPPCPRTLDRPFSLRRPACLSAPRAAATAGTASQDLRIANSGLAAGPRPHGAARAATARAAPRIAPLP